MDTESGRDAYFMNGRSISKNDLQNIFKMSDIQSFHDVSKLVQIGKINEIAHMDQQQMMSLLLYYSGATSHEEKLSDIKKYLSQIDDKKEELKQYKLSVEEKLDFIASKVEDFQKFNDLTLKKNAYEYLLKSRQAEEIGDKKYKNLSENRQDL